MRIIETKLFTYDELSDPAKLKARGELYAQLVELGIVADDLRTVAANWLNDNGWSGFRELAEGEVIAPDDALDLIQFSIAFVQGDYVAWNGTKQFEFEGQTYTVQTKITRDYMTVDVDTPQVRPLHHAREMVSRDSRVVLDAMHDYDLRLTEDEDYLSNFAEANEIEFTQDGGIYR